MKKSPTLGILGGLGPMSGIYFCELLTTHTRAERDQDHLHFLLSSCPEIPDRTDFILGRSDRNPLPAMIREVQRLSEAGADLIAIPCNTAHHFFDGIADCVSVPVLNIIDETVAFCASRGDRSIGILATEGTVASGAYAQVCERSGLSYLTCTPEEQRTVSAIIYEQIKRGQAPDLSAFSDVLEALLDRGCDTVVLGCTELSLLKKLLPEDPRVIDSLEVLAYSSLCLCQKETVGFPTEFHQYLPMKGKRLCY